MIIIVWTAWTRTVPRVMAWHVRTALNDVQWRSEAGIHLPDHRTPPEWVDDLAARFAALDVRTTTRNPQWTVRSQSAG